MKRIPDILRERRLASGISLKEVEKATKVPLEVLQRLEEGRWQSFASYAYLQGVIRKYARYLGMDEGKALSYLKRDYQSSPAEFIRRTDYREDHRTVPHNWYFFLVGLLIVSFFAIQFLLSWQKPLLDLKPLPKELIVNQPLIVKGETQPGVLLYLNDEQIYQNQQGFFREELYFKKPGLREIVIKALGVNGKEEIRRQELVIKPAK